MPLPPLTPPYKGGEEMPRLRSGKEKAELVNALVNTDKDEA